MDLSTAKREAATRSMETQKDVFVNLLENGSHELAGKAGKQPMLKFSKGVEVPLPKKEVVVAKTAPTKVAKAPAKKEKEVKKPAKKIVADKKEVKQKDKAMKKPMKKSSQKVVNRVAAPKGKAVTMTAKQLRAKVEEGNHVYNSKGREIPCTMMANNEPTKKLNVIVSGSGNKKHYHITRTTGE